MKKSDLAREVRALLGTPDKWIQGNFAEDDAGFCTRFHMPEATKFCLHGGFWRIGMECNQWALCQECILQLAEMLGVTHTLASYNDSHLYEEVMALLDSFISMLEKEEAQCPLVVSYKERKKRVRCSYSDHPNAVSVS